MKLCFVILIVGASLCLNTLCSHPVQQDERGYCPSITPSPSPNGSPLHERDTKVLETTKTKYLAATTTRTVTEDVYLSIVPDGTSNVTETENSSLGGSTIPPGDSNKTISIDSDPNIAMENNQTQSEQQQLNQETVTIHRVIVILCSLGAVLALIAIAIALLFWQIRRQQRKQQREQRSAQAQNSDDSTPLSKASDDNSCDSGGGNGNGTASSNETSRVHASHLAKRERLTTLDEKILEEARRIVESQQLATSFQSQHTPSAPPLHKLDNFREESLSSSEETLTSNYPTAPPNASPPEYTPSAPPVYQLPHIPIPDYPVNQSMNDIILQTEGSRSGPNSPTLPHPVVFRQNSLPIYVTLPPLQTDTRDSTAEGSTDCRQSEISPYSLPSSPLDGVKPHSPRRSKNQRRNSSEI